MARLISLVVLVLTVAARQHGQIMVSSAPPQMWLFLAPEEHSCGPSVVARRPDQCSSPRVLRRSTAGLWAGGLSLALPARYDAGVLRLVVIGVASRTKTAQSSVRPARSLAVLLICAQRRARSTASPRRLPAAA
jgi:hypothetical protein